MGLSFAHPVALWALLGLPVVVAIHFLQSRERRERVSTLFLLDLLPEETRKGAVFTRLLAGPQLWLQLLTVLLLTLLLARPMWLRQESVQTVAVVVDVSASMRAFREETRTRIAAMLERLDGTAGRTEWLILPSDITRPRIYRGADPQLALAAIEALPLTAGPHPYRPALLQARRLIGAKGGLVLVTDHPPEQVPVDTAVLGVGQAKANLGIAGIRMTRRDNGEWAWEASLVHPSTVPSTATLRVFADDRELSSQDLSLEPGGLSTLSGRLPTDSSRGLLVLGEDGFDLDNQFPFVLPEVPPLPYTLDLPDAAAEWAVRVFGTVEGAQRQDQSALVAWRQVGNLIPLPERPYEILMRTGGPQGAYQRPVAVPHELTRDLVWSGLVALPRERLQISGETVLVWMGDLPLISLIRQNDTTRMLLNFDLEESNAERHPGMVMLLNRFLTQVRDRQAPVRVENLATGQRLEDLPDPEGRILIRFQPVGGTPRETTQDEPPERTPDLPGWWTVALPEVEQPLLRAGIAFQHPEEGDLRNAAARPLPADWVAGRRTLNSEQDVLRPLWFLLLGLTLTGSWWAGSKRSRR